jgi:hypothetical protein
MHTGIEANRCGTHGSSTGSSEDGEQLSNSPEFFMVMPLKLLMIKKKPSTMRRHCKSFYLSEWSTVATSLVRWTLSLEG